jgi:hypothetical protein
MVMRINLTVLALVVGGAALLASMGISGFLLFNHSNANGGASAGAAEVPEASHGTFSDDLHYQVEMAACTQSAKQGPAAGLPSALVEEYCDCALRKIVDAFDGDWDRVGEVGMAVMGYGSASDEDTEAFIDAMAACTVSVLQ